MENGSITLEEIVKGIKPVDKNWVDKAKERTSMLLMPFMISFKVILPISIIYYPRLIDLQVA